MNGELTQIGVARWKIARTAGRCGEQFEQLVHLGLFSGVRRLRRKQYRVLPLSRPRSPPKPPRYERATSRGHTVQRVVISLTGLSHPNVGAAMTPKREILPGVGARYDSSWRVLDGGGAAAPAQCRRAPTPRSYRVPVSRARLPCGAARR